MGEGRTLSMTSRAAGQNIRSLNVKSLNEFYPFLLLIRRRSPFHVENLLFRSHEIFRRTMTFQTPLHLQRLRLRNHRHLIDAAVASRTTNAFIHMNRVIEIREVGKVMHAHPLQGFAGLETRAHRFQVRTVSPNLLVAVHANGGRRHARRRRSFNRRMAIATIDAVVADVVFMTELNWLLALDVLAGVPA